MEQQKEKKVEYLELIYDLIFVCYYGHFCVRNLPVDSPARRNREYRIRRRLIIRKKRQEELP